MTDADKGISRRTLVKGAAWSLPAIAMVAAAPAYAASGGTPADLFDLYLTAGEVIGLGDANGRVESNGVRISPKDPANPPVVAAGTVIDITLTYTGSIAAFDFLNFPFPYTLAIVMANNAPWTLKSSSATKVVLTATTPFDSTEPTIGQFTWPLDPHTRPEDESITFTGIATIAPGGGFPAGGTLTPLLVDPNGGTGNLSGPDQTTWPP